MALQDELLSAGEREKDLQRQLLQTQLCVEQQAEQLKELQQKQSKQQSARGTGTAMGAEAAQRLQQQFEAAAAALVTAQQRMAAQESDLQHLRQQMQTAAATDAHGKGSTASPWSAAVATAAGQMSPFAAVALTQPSAEASGFSALDPDLFSALPSPMGPLPPTPGSGASFWLGSTRGFGARDTAAGVVTGSSKVRVAAGASGATAGGGAGWPAGQRNEPVIHGVDTHGGGGVAVMAAQVLGNTGSIRGTRGCQGRYQSLSSLRNSLEEANLLLGSPRPGSPSLQQQGRLHVGKGREQGEMRCSLFEARLVYVWSASCISSRSRVVQLTVFGDTSCQACGSLICLC